MKNPPISQLIAICMTLLFIMSIIWIVNDKVQKEFEAQKQSSFTNGTYYGYQQAIFEIVNKASKCENIDLNVYNTTFRLREVRCE